MEQIELRRPVAIKVLMTDDFRKQLILEARETLARIEDNLKHMELALEQQAAAPGGEGQELRKQIELEKARLMQLEKELNWRVAELEAVQNGAELPFRVFEGPVTLRVGDNFLDKLTRAEVVIQDWKVVEIREA
ncbi:MAG: YlqD family protein [Candidatus Eremiobacteraeota bacterium]|nr:YlqD family protein [Candidatus Eremiobacteraeota bacterium]